MAVPIALTESGGDKVAGPLFDNGGANAWAYWRGVANATQNGEPVAALQVGTHADGVTWGAGGPVVVVGGLDGTTVRKMAVDGSGGVKLQPQLVWDNGGAVADARLRAVAKTTLSGTAIGHLAVGTQADGDTWVASDAVVVVGGLDGTTVRKAKVDSSGRFVVSQDYTFGGTGHQNADGATAVALRATTACRKVRVKADAANANTIYLGTSGVTGDETAGTGGWQLESGDEVEVEVQNVNTLCIRGTNGQGVSYMWWT